MRPKVEVPSDEEEAAIQRGIAQDPDNPELGDEWFERARPAREVLPSVVYEELVPPAQPRGPRKRTAKVQVTLRLDRDVLERLRASGPGWQVRASEALRRLSTRLNQRRN
jgi:uncharacterized protein (DUF4415 family)